MGLGGYLTWTAAAREIRKHYGLRSLPIESLPNGFFKIINSKIFRDNPNFALNYPENKQEEVVFPLVLNAHETNYVKEDFVDRVLHRHDKHIIHLICEFYGIKNAPLECEMFFNDNVNQVVDEKVKRIGGEFIVIEPHSKLDFTTNRVYPFEKWQKIVDWILENTHYKVVQVGLPDKERLRGTTWSATGFFSATGLIGKSRLFLSSEGGLVHAATAVDTKSLVVITSYQSEKMVAYPQNINIYVGRHDPCGLKTRCPDCKRDAQDHDYNEIIDAIKQELKNDKK